MKFSKTVSVVVASMMLGATAWPVLAKQDGKAKGKSAEKKGTKENSGREAGELPSGLQKHSEKKGSLPSGLQKKKDEDGQLTKGLTAGGRKTDAPTKASKPSK